MLIVEEKIFLLHVICCFMDLLQLCHFSSKLRSTYLIFPNIEGILCFW